MAITVQANLISSIDQASAEFYGLAADIKPTLASHDGLPAPAIGSTYFEYDTGDMYVTYDGTNWVFIPE